jgi:HK97 family phage prohead protease
MEKMYKTYEEKSADGARIITAAISSETIDRDGEIVTAAAIKAAMAGYMKNPVVMTYHKHSLGDGAPTVIGKVISWRQDKGTTYAEIEFAETDLATQYWQLYAGKFQRAFSIGFNTIKAETRYIDNKAVKVHTAIDLFEISAVGVPANPDAITKTFKDDSVIKAMTDTLTKQVKDAVAEQFKTLELFLTDQLDQVKDMLHGGTLGYADDSILGESSDLSDAGADADAEASVVLNRITKTLKKHGV